LSDSSARSNNKKPRQRRAFLLRAGNGQSTRRMLAPNADSLASMFS
jgi:hypothetical protein